MGVNNVQVLRLTPHARALGNPRRDPGSPIVKTGDTSPDSRVVTTGDASFHDEFVALFHKQFPSLFRYLDRLTSEPELAADIAQEAFIRLYQKGTLPDTPSAWLVSVAMNLFRNAQTTRSRRRRLLTPDRMQYAHADPAPSPDAGVSGDDTRDMVRAALGRLPERERQLLLLRAEGLSYREISVALNLNEGSVGVLLARAKQAFRAACKDGFHAP